MEPYYNVEQCIEEYIRVQFGVSPTDPGFDREADLFEEGYVDSMGVVELLEFLREEFGVEIPDNDLLSDDFSSISGIARIVASNIGPQTEVLRDRVI
jgi:acyl carrier protein